MKIFSSVGLHAMRIRADRTPKRMKAGKDGTHEQNEN